MKVFILFVMLTKTDLKQIEGIVQGVVRNETRQIIQQELEPIRKETRQIIQQELEPIRKDTKTLKRDMRYVKKTIDIMVRMFNEDDVKLRKRVEKIEDHLGFVQP
ncbi:MAG: hypothetical protein A3J14_03250 [Candidatus Levybacteria bacterium RIFCSPLOWO2_02_FULL_37_18]|nr:MAG: hypothetical protein A3J14_03250 [Candidatus Levybacteria bacterium RIFCSPLOWO2_02_FULL_37_18]